MGNVEAPRHTAGRKEKRTNRGQLCRSCSGLVLIGLCALTQQTSPAGGGNCLSQPPIISDVEAQRGEATGLRSHSQQVMELVSELSLTTKSPGHACVHTHAITWTQYMHIGRHAHTHTHTHTRAHMFILALTHTHIPRPETKVLTWLAGAGPGLHPSDPGSISFLPPLPPSLPQMFAEAPASRPDVRDAPGCLRDPEAKEAAR